MAREVLACQPSAGSIKISLFIQGSKVGIIGFLTGIKDEDVIDNSLFPVALSAPKDNQVLAKLCGRVTIPCAWRLPIDLSADTD